MLQWNTMGHQKQTFQLIRIFYLVVCLVVAKVGGISSLSEPLVSQPGDFVIVGLFDIGDWNQTISKCKLSGSSVYALEKALVFQDLMKDFAVGNYSIGYEIYSGCKSEYLNRQISSKVAVRDDVVGMLSSDWSKGVEPSIGSPTSFFIPTISYIYSEDTFLDQDKYPTYLSLLETEDMEAMSIINLLKFLEVQFVDVWYNRISEKMAKFVYNQYVLTKIGGGRLTYFNGYDGVDEEFEEYDRDSQNVRPAPVQLLLFNGNINHVIPYLNETVHVRKWRNKTYIFGYTVSRDHYRPSQQEILEKELDVENEIFIYLRSEIQNANQEKLTVKGGVLFDRAKDADDTISENYRLYRDCNFSGSVQHLDQACASTKPFTSWMSYVATATVLLKNNLEQILPGFVPQADIFALRKKLFESLVSGKHSVVIYGKPVNDLSFEDSTSSLGYEVLEYRKSTPNSTEENMGKVHHKEVSTEVLAEELDLTLKEHVKEIGGTVSCSPDCPAGSHIALVSSYPGLSKCWTCHRCTDSTVSHELNSKKCTKCQKTERASGNNTECLVVPKNFISLDSPQFLVGLTLGSVAGGLTLLLILFIFFHRTRPVIKASDPVFCYLFLGSLCLGDVLTVLTLLEPSSLTCQVELYVCSIFVVSVCTNLFFRSVKIYKIFVAAANFEITRPFIFKFLTREAQYTILFAMMIVTALLTLASISLGGWVFAEKLDPHVSIEKICVSANFLATVYPFIIPSILLTGTLFLAYKMRLFPHNFKETTTIFTTTLILVVICLMFLSGYSVSEPSMKSILRAIVYFCISQSFLYCLFLPKVVILLKKDDLINAEGNLSAAIQSYCDNNEKRKSLCANASATET